MEVETTDFNTLSHTSGGHQWRRPAILYEVTVNCYPAIWRVKKNQFRRFLVGGFNPSEKLCKSQIGSSLPQVWVNKNGKQKKQNFETTKVICPDKSPMWHESAPAVCAFAPLRQNSTWNGGPKGIEHQNIENLRRLKFRKQTSGPYGFFTRRFEDWSFFEKKPSDHNHIIELNSNFWMCHHFFLGSFLFASLFLDTLETKEPEPQKKNRCGFPAQKSQNLRGTKWYPPQRRRRSFVFRRSRQNRGIFLQKMGHSNISAFRLQWIYLLHLFFGRRIVSIHPLLSAPPPKQQGLESFELTDGRNPAITSWCWWFIALFTTGLQVLYISGDFLAGFLNHQQYAKHDGCFFFFRAQKSQTTTVWMVLKPSLIMGFQLPFPQLVFVYRISESSTSYVSEVPQTENSKTVEIPNMKLTLTERPRMAHTKTTSRGAGLRLVSNRSFDSESWTKKQLQLEESRFFRRFLEKLAWSF